MVPCSVAEGIEPWKLRLIHRRARRFGFRGAELDDVKQEVALELMAFRFDPARANGAKETTVLRVLIDGRLRTLRRARRRYERRVTPWDAAFGQPDSEPLSSDGEDNDSASVVLDVQEALAGLSPEDRSLAPALAEGQSLRQIAARQGMSWHRLQRGLDRIRRHFAARGLDGCLPGEE